MIRQEGRAAEREQGIYERNQADQIAKEKRGIDISAATEAAKLKAQQDFYANNPEAPATIEANLKNQQTQANIDTSKQNIANAQLSNQKTQLEIDKLNQASDIVNRYKSATTDEERKQIADEWNLTTGKGIRTKIDNIVTVDVPTGEYDNNGKSITRKALIDYSDPTKPKELPIEALKTPTKPYSSTEANDIAKRIMDQRYPNGRPSFYHPEDRSTYDSELKQYSNDLQNRPKDQDVPITGLKGKIVRNGLIVDEQPQQPTGMLNKPTANMNANELKNSKSVYAIIANRESGSEGVNANNPKSSAGGTFQLTDETAKTYGAKADASGKIPNSEKDIAAGKFYADIEKWAGDSPTVILAAGFGQNAVKSAYEKDRKSTRLNSSHT